MRSPKFTLANIAKYHFVVSQNGLFFSVCVFISENRDLVDRYPPSHSGVLQSSALLQAV